MTVDLKKQDPKDILVFQITADMTTSVVLVVDHHLKAVSTLGNDLLQIRASDEGLYHEEDFLYFILCEDPYYVKS